MIHVFYLTLTSKATLYIYTDVVLPLLRTTSALSVTQLHRFPFAQICVSFVDGLFC